MKKKCKDLFIDSILYSYFHDLASVCASLAVTNGEQRIDAS